MAGCRGGGGGLSLVVLVSEKPNLVSEKSGKSQGILFICGAGNPALSPPTPHCHHQHPTATTNTPLSPPTPPTATTNTPLPPSKPHYHHQHPTATTNICWFIEFNRSVKSMFLFNFEFCVPV